MEQIQTQNDNVETSRAKQIDTGATPLTMSNVIIGLPFKPTTSNLETRVGTSAANWTWKDLVSQKRLVTDLLVTTGTRGIIWNFHNTWRNVCNTIFRHNMDVLFTLKSWTINFEFEFRTSWQQLGQFIVFYSNLPQNNFSYHFNLATVNDPNPYENYMIQTQLPHRKVPMGEDVNCVTSLKWLSPLKASFAVNNLLIDGSEPSATVAADDMYDMGTLFLAVPWELEVATGVTPDCSVRIWAYLSDVTYAGYQVRDTSI